MKEELRSVFSLNEKQQKAFNKLEKAYNECIKEGIYFVNMYGTLNAYDKSLISDYDDDPKRMRSTHSVCTKSRTFSLNSINIPNEWTDDEHYYGMTKKGYKYFIEYDDGEV